jgi:SAM-dependent methyltransferase
MDENLDKQMDCFWPENGLEILGLCPICESMKRTKLYEGLKDRLFYCSPGEWTLWKCSNCGSAYIDPRPNKETISLAYANYFTHESSPNTLKELGLWRWFRRSFANGYRNYFFKTNLHPSNFIGTILALFPSQRNTIESSLRNIDKKFSISQKLLDIGCGNGDFLYSAKTTGREVTGVEIDTEAASIARAKGLDVRTGDISVLDSDKESFDIITLGHVIEHVHDPLSLLRKCYQLLKKNGYIWIDTPNIDSEGHRIYGLNWKDLDPPRHIILFSYESLRMALRNAGFCNIQDMSYRPLCKVFPKSEALFEGKRDATEANLKSASALCKQYIKMAEKLARKNPQARESITIKAWKY